MTLRIHLLGQMCLEASDQVLPGSALAGRQGRLTLAYLALAGHPVSRDELADVVWPNDLPRSWERDLSAVVSKLKAQLTRIGAPDAVRGALGCYQIVLPPGAVVDVDDARVHLEQAEAALRVGATAEAWGAASAAFNLTSRPFLPGEEGEWVEARREELRGLVVRAADVLVAIEAARGHWAEAAGYAEEAIARAPYRESGYVALVDVHLGAGNRAEALRTYERARSLLAEELGVPPSAPLEEAYRRALLADAPSPVAPPAVPAAGAGRDSPLLVGRTLELNVLNAALRRATGGRGGLVLVAGEPGIGKTRLAEAIAAEAEGQGFLVVWSSCWPGDGAPPLWPWTQVLRELAARQRVDDVDLLSQLTHGEPRGGLLGELDPGGARFRLFDRAATSLRRATEAGPLLVVLDDLQWADRTSLQLLQLASCTLRSASLLLVGTYRDTEVGPRDPLAELLDETSRDAERLQLVGLERGALGTLAGSIAGAPVAADLEEVLRDHTAGNPFFVKELVRLLVAQGRLGAPGPVPAGVREVLDRRLARLSPTCREALRVASVIGRRFDLSLLGEAIGAGPDEISAVVDEARVARVIREASQDRCTFVHELFVQALYEGLPRADRLRAHLAVGRALELRHGLGTGPHLAEVAHHLVTSAVIGDAAQAAQAADAAERAGAQAARVLAFDEAADWYQRALSIVGDAGEATQRARLLVALGDAQLRARDGATGRASIAEAARLARRVGDGALLGRAALVLGGGLGGAQPLAEPDHQLVALLDEALAALPSGDSGLRCRVLARLAAELYLTDEVARRDELSAEAVAMGRRLRDDAALATALYARQIALLGPDGLADREAAGEEVLALAAESGDQELAFWGHLFRVWSRTERCLRVDDDLAACARIADELGVAAYRAEVAVRRAVVAVVAGRFDEVDRQLAMVDAAAPGAASTTLTSLLVLNSWLRGPLEELEPLVARLVTDHPDRPLWRAALATLYAELGRVEDAQTQVAALAAKGAGLPRDALWLFAMQFLGLVCVTVGDEALAGELFQLVVPYAEQAPVGAMGSAMTTIGLLDAARGNPDGGLEWLERGRRRNLAHGNEAFALWSERERAAVLLARGGLGDRDRARAGLEGLVGQLRQRGFHGFLVRAERLLAEARQ